jgi:protein-L-isoaspartate(D-aspartate) O-methyltransferase
VGSDLVADARAHGVHDERVLQAMGEIRRALFVPSEHVGRADDDEPIPIGHAQVTTQPSLVAEMVEALGLRGPEHVLEVGTGYGYQSALLARLAAFVWTIEWWDDLAAAARTNLERAGIGNVEVVVGDGTLGLPEHAPFDGIVVTAAHTRVPAPLVDQLSPGGRLVQPIGPGGREDVVLFEKDGDHLVRRRTIVPARFVRLHGVHGYPVDE